MINTKQKHLRVLVTLLIMLLSSNIYSQAFNKMFSPVPEAGASIGDTKKEWRPIVNIPAIKIIESQRENAELDALLLTSTGGGISYQKMEFDGTKWKSKWSLSPATFLLTGNIADNNVDISWAATFGFLNNLIMVGAGRDFGQVEGRSRWFGVLSIGVNLNN